MSDRETGERIGHVERPTDGSGAIREMWDRWHRSRLNGLLSAEEAEAFRALLDWAASQRDVWRDGRMAAARKVLEALGGGD